MSDSPVTATTLYGEDPSEVLWSVSSQLIYGGAALGAVGAGIGFFSNVSHWALAISSGLAGGGAIALGLWMQNSLVTEIPVTHVGLLTMRGEPQDVIAQPGRKIVWSGWPFYQGYEVILVEPVNETFAFKDMRVRATHTADESDSEKNQKTGSTVDIKISISVKPNVESCATLWSYVKNGAMEGIIPRIKVAIEQALKDISIDYDWETLSRLRSRLVVMLMSRLTKIDMHKLPLIDGEVDPEKMNISLKEYEALDPITDPLSYLFPDPNDKPDNKPETDEEKLADQKNETRFRQEIDVFMRLASANDFPDIFGWGVKFTQLNTGEIKPEKLVDEAASQAAAEHLQRVRDKANNDTFAEMAEDLVRKSIVDGKPTLNFKEALQKVLVINGKATESSIRVDSPNNDPLTGAAAVLANAISSKK